MIDEALQFYCTAGWGYLAIVTGRMIKSCNYPVLSCLTSKLKHLLMERWLLLEFISLLVVWLFGFEMSEMGSWSTDILPAPFYFLPYWTLVFSRRCFSSAANPWECSLPHFVHISFLSQKHLFIPANPACLNLTTEPASTPLLISSLHNFFQIFPYSES